MTISEKLINEYEVRLEECDSLEKSLKQNDSCNQNEVNESHSDDIIKKSNTKTLSRRAKKNRKTKKKKEEKHKNEEQEYHNMSLHDYKEWDEVLPEKTEKEIEKPITIHKNKILSPTHKLTEYFIDLNVCDKKNIKESKLKQTHTDLNKDKNKTNLLSPKVLCSDNLAQTSKKRVRQLKSKSTELTNHKVTEYFQVRRSNRQFTKSLIDAQQKDLENKILDKVEDGLEVKEFKDKGRGVITTKEFYKGDFVVEYIGELIDITTAKERENKYATNKKIGCYMYYFKHKNNRYCIDATKESGYLGRLINHSRKGNLMSRIVEIHDTPHLVFYAKTDIPIGTEVLYDYGDRNPNSLINYPWLNS